MVSHIIAANVGVLFKLSAFKGEECKGIKPVFRSETLLFNAIDLVHADDTASLASLGEPTILLETAEGTTSEISIASCSSGPASKGRVPPPKKPTITFASSN